MYFLLIFILYIMFLLPFVTILLQLLPINCYKAFLPDFGFVVFDHILTNETNTHSYTHTTPRIDEQLYLHTIRSICILYVYVNKYMLPKSIYVYRENKSINILQNTHQNA